MRWSDYVDNSLAVTRRFKQSETMTPLLLFITVLHGADAWFLLTNFEGNLTEAKLSCSRARGRLPLPGDGVGNSALAEHLQSNDVTSTWVDVELVVTPWHSNGVDILYNQGCHGAGILRNRIYHKRWKSCRPFCKGLKYQFAGFLRSGSSATCVCLNYITPVRRLRDSECRGEHYDGCRVVTTSQSNRYPVVNLPWTARSGSIGGMCALTVTVLSGSNLDIRLEEDYCYKPHYALCCVQDTTLTFPMYTWFDAHYKCFVLGGRIITQRDRCGQSHTDPDDYSTTHFWSGVHAWVWYINDTLTPENRFTNWSREQPSLESGSCVVVTREGAWESASCDKPRTVVCETDDPPTTVGQHSERSLGSNSGKTGIVTGVVVGVLAILTLVGAVVFVLMRRNGKTNRGSPTHLDNPVYSQANNDVIIDRTDHGPHGTTIQENSLYGSSGNNGGADSAPHFSESTVKTVGGAGSGGQSTPRDVSSARVTIVDNELYGASHAEDTFNSDPVYSLEQQCDDMGQHERRHDDDDDDDVDDGDDGDDGDDNGVSE